MDVVDTFSMTATSVHSVCKWGLACLASFWTISLNTGPDAFKTGFGVNHGGGGEVVLDEHYAVDLVSMQELGC